MEEKILENLKLTRNASNSLQDLSEELCNSLLVALSKKICSCASEIIEENKKDLYKMSQDNPMYDRLLLNESRIHAMVHDMETLLNLNAEIGNVIEEKERPNGLRIQKRRVPLGVVAVIYESRPNVTTDVFSLCFKARNACVLKGGKEALHTNTILVRYIREILAEHHIDPHVIYLLPSDREAMLILLKATQFIDVCIPRGGQGLIQFVRENARIPVIETGAGIVHSYFDKSGDIEKGKNIILNAKTRRVSVCNALDGLIIHESRLNDLFYLIEPLIAHSVEIFADEKSYVILNSHYPASLLHPARPENFGQEFLSYKMSIKTVNNLQEALDHIQKYSSGHSEAIIAEDEKILYEFLNRVDSAAVYANTSTAFTDGAQFGLGTEIGISTQKLHARGPMGLEALSTYKWCIYGEGQIRP